MALMVTLRSLLAAFTISLAAIVATASDAHLSTAPAAANNGPPPCIIRTAWNQFPPYQFSRPDGTPDGIDVRLLDEAAARMGCTVHWTYLPRQRSIIMIREGNIDAQPGMSWTPERTAFGIYSKPLRAGVNALFVRRGESNRFSFTGMRGMAESDFRLAAQAGTKYSAEFEKLMADGTFTHKPAMALTTQNAVQMLLTGRVDGFFDGQLTGRWELRLLGLDGEVEEYPRLATDGDAFVLFSRRSVAPEIVEKFDAAIAAMRDDGSYARIIAEGERLVPQSPAPTPIR